LSATSPGRQFITADLGLQAYVWSHAPS